MRTSAALAGLLLPARFRPDLVPDGHARHPGGRPARHHGGGHRRVPHQFARRGLQGAVRGDRRHARRCCRPRRRRRSIPKSPVPVVPSIKLKVTVAADAHPGVREFRIATRLGISSLGQLVVVDAPVVLETARHQHAGEGPGGAGAVVVCGRVEAAEDVDYYKFPAKAGQTLTFEVLCARIQDKIHDLQKHADPLVAVYDADGQGTGRQRRRLLRRPGADVHRAEGRRVSRRGPRREVRRRPALGLRPHDHRPAVRGALVPAGRAPAARR